MNSVLSTSWNIIRGRRALARFRSGDVEPNRKEQPLCRDFKSLKDLRVLEPSSNCGPLDHYPLWLSRAFVIVFLLQRVRPTRVPFAHMSMTLPFTLVQNPPQPNKVCYSRRIDISKPFPLSHLLSQEFWEEPDGFYPGWKPKTVHTEVDANMTMVTPRLSWLPKEMISGFERWYPDPSSPSEVPRVIYDPADDPLKIGNLDMDIFEPLQEALTNKDVRIKHIVILTLESIRKDVFPMRTNSHLYDSILASYGKELQVGEINAKLADLTPIAELLTGETTGFDPGRHYTDKIKPGGWRDQLFQGKGGINVVEAITASTVSSKAILSNHCSVNPIPVDFTEESHLQTYQPCIPHILDLFNRNKPKLPPPQHYLSNKITRSNTMPYSCNNRNTRSRHQ